MKINISVRDDIVEQVEKYCEKFPTTKSAVFAQGAMLLIAQASIPVYLQQIAVAMKRIADNNAISEDEKNKLEEFQKLAELLTTPMR